MAPNTERAALSLVNPAAADSRAHRFSWGQLRQPLETALIATEVVAAVAILAIAVPQFQGSIVAFLLLLTLNLAMERSPISIYGDTSITVGFIFTIAIIVLFGVPGIVLVAPAETLARRLGRKPINYRLAQMIAQHVCVYAIAAVVYGMVADVNPTVPSIGMIAGAALATLVCFGLLAALVTLGSSLRTGEPLATIWGRQSWVAPHFAGMGIVGTALATAYIALDIAGLLTFMVPVLMTRLTMKQYVSKTEENVEVLKQQNTALKTANIEIVRISDELRESYDGTLEALVNALDARDQETKGHSLRVSRYMMDIARELGVKEGTEEWLTMQRGSLLHDVGKIGVIDSILLNPGKLTDEEWVEMRKHPEIGYNMLSQVSFLKGPAEIILCHHERWDGKGYPRGLHQDEIPLGARIFPVVDTFDAMTSDRPYRRAKTTLEAMNEILRCGGTQFDPLVVEAFLDIYTTWVAAREEMHSTDMPKAA